jgi:hypothetical protein
METLEAVEAQQQEARRAQGVLSREAAGLFREAQVSCFTDSARRRRSALAFVK